MDTAMSRKATSIEICMIQTVIDDIYFPYQQSSTDIWHAICAAVKAACSLANVAGEEVAGLGFAATCSLGWWNSANICAPHLNNGTFFYKLHDMFYMYHLKYAV